MLLYNLERFGGKSEIFRKVKYWKRRQKKNMACLVKPGNLCLNRAVIRGRTVGVCISDVRSLSTPAWPCLSPQHLVRVSGNAPIHTTVASSLNSGNRSCHGQPVRWQDKKKQKEKGEPCLQLLPSPANSRRRSIGKVKICVQMLSAEAGCSAQRAGCLKR